MNPFPEPACDPLHIVLEHRMPREVSVSHISEEGNWGTREAIVVKLRRNQRTRKIRVTPTMTPDDIREFPDNTARELLATR